MKLEIYNKRVIGNDQQKWEMKILGYDFEIQQRLRYLNKTIDVISRNPNFERQMQAISMTRVVSMKGIDQRVVGDEKLERIIQYLLRDPNSHGGQTLKEGTLSYKRMVVLPKNSTYIP